MASIKNCWIDIAIALCTFRFCRSWTFEIERNSPRSTYDVIPNDFGISANGQWIKLTECNKDCVNTTGLNTGCLTRIHCCSCKCSYGSSTFRMGPTARDSSCVRNEVMRSSAGCEFLFQDKGSSQSVLSVLKLDKSAGNRYVLKTPVDMTQSSVRCNVKGKAEYWDYGKWKNVNETDLFTVYNRYQSYFKWKRTDKYKGRIMRQSLQCNDTSSQRSQSSCIIFKVSGTLQYTINPKPTSKAPSSTGTTTQKLSQTTPTTRRSSSQHTTRLTTSFSVQSTTVPPPSHMSTSTTENIPPTYKRSSTLQTLYSTKDGSTTEKISTEASKMTSEMTDQPTTGTEVEPGTKGAHGDSGDSDGGNNTLMIAAIGAASAIICVIIICIFLWFMMKRKQNNRNNEACSTDMTVITNGTGMNNSSAAPTLKNPVYDNAGYGEPTEKRRPYPKQLPILAVGNPVYDKAIAVNSNNNSHQNIQPSRKPKSKKDKNHYDNEDEDEAYENPGYQDLISIPIKPVNNSVSDNSTYDNAYAEPEKSNVYEQLTKDSVYQPLVHNSQDGQNIETPEYLALLDESSSPSEQNIPEYLTLVNDENNQTQPEATEYDYAFVDGEKKQTPLKAPSTKVPGTSQHGPPVYDVLEDPNDQGPPVYDVLEDPNVQGPPVYDVLEDSNDQGPPVYNVLEDPNDRGPPVYDVLEDPNDQGPPVYDVLEGPDSGDDYLVPIEGNQLK